MLIQAHLLQPNDSLFSERDGAGRLEMSGSNQPRPVGDLQPVLVGQVRMQMNAMCTLMSSVAPARLSSGNLRSSC